MDVLTLIQEARTCRRFVENAPLGQENLEWLVECARLSPCARNAQVLRFAVAASPASCAAVFPHTRWANALPDGRPQEGERPTGYIAILTPADAGKLVHMDTGIAAQSMQLAAWSKGWGCCMHASFAQKEVAQILRVPQEMVIGLLLAFGQANEVRCIAPMPADGSFAYWRDADKKHYVPKRSHADVLVSVV